MPCRDHTIRQLQAKAEVLEKGKESAGRKFKGELLAARRQAEVEKRQVAKLKVCRQPARVHAMCGACPAKPWLWLCMASEGVAACTV